MLLTEPITIIILITGYVCFLRLQDAPSHIQTRLSREVKEHVVASQLSRKLQNPCHLVLKPQRTRCRSLKSQMFFYTTLVSHHPLRYCKLTESWRGTATDTYPRGEGCFLESWPWSVAAETLHWKSEVPHTSPHPALPFRRSLRILVS